jgi:outer membrane protein assembly factor BamB
VIWKSFEIGQVNIWKITADVLFASNAKDQIFALRTSDGKLLWRFDGGSYALTGITVADGAVFAGTSANYSGSVTPKTPDGYLYALRPSDGRELWRYPAKGYVGNTFATSKAVYLGSGDGHVYALKISNGEEIWNRETGGDWQVGPVDAGSTVLVGAGNTATSDGSVSTSTPGGHVYALRAGDGRQIWDFRTGSTPGPLAAADGVAYIWSYDGNVYAIRV